MTRTQVVQILVVLALVAFAVMWLLNQKPAPTYSSPAPAVQTTKVPPKPVQTPELPRTVETAPVPEMALTNRDPFQPPAPLREKIHQRELAREEEARRKKGQRQGEGAPAPIQPPPLQLQGILWGTAKPQAIINRQVVSVGDTIGEATIVAVTQEGVTISFSGSEFQLKLPQKGAAGTSGGGR